MSCITFFQVSKCYPTTTAGFAPELINLLDTQYAVLDGQLRKALVQALILMRNRNQVSLGRQGTGWQQTVCM